VLGFVPSPSGAIAAQLHEQRIVTRLLAAKDNHCEQQADDSAAAGSERGPSASTYADGALAVLLYRSAQILNRFQFACLSSAARSGAASPLPAPFFVKGDQS
jgi:hypothetical protein